MRFSNWSGEVSGNPVEVVFEVVMNVSWFEPEFHFIAKAESSSGAATLIP